MNFALEMMNSEFKRMNLGRPGVISHVFTSEDLFYSGFESGTVYAMIDDNGRFTAGVVASPYTVLGCGDSKAFNYVAETTLNFTCIEKSYGCTDHLATNYDISANTDAANCSARVDGCTEPGGYNYMVNATHNEDGTNDCVYDICAAGVPFHNCSYNATCTYLGGVTFSCACNDDYMGDGYDCKKIKEGCMETDAYNYDPSATYQLDNTSTNLCIDKVYGCMDDTMSNFELQANTDNLSFIGGNGSIYAAVGLCIPKVYGCAGAIYGSSNHGFCISNHGFCISNHGFCISNDGFCISNDVFCIRSDRSER